MIGIYYYVYLLFFICFIISILIWNSQLHKSLKYQQFLQLIIALTIVFTSFAIIIQIFSLTITQNDTEIQLYETLFNSLILDTFSYFENNPKMNYFYNQMFKPLHYNPDIPIKSRDYTGEQQIVHSILTRMSTILYYLETDKIINNSENKNKIINKLNLFFLNVKSSPIFMENYNNIKDRLFTNSLKNYLKTNFNL